MAHQAGGSTRQMAEKRRWKILIISILGIIAIIGGYIILKNPKLVGNNGYILLGLLLLIMAIPSFIDRKTRKVYKARMRAERGAQGEEKVGELLSQLGGDYAVLNDVSNPNGNIDHVVISQNSGIFLIETKAHGGKVTIDGEQLLVNGHAPEKDFIKQTLRNAFWLRDVVKSVTGSEPWINSILVFTNAFVSVPKPIKGIKVTNKKYLLSAIQSVKAGERNAIYWEKREEIFAKLR